MLICLWDPESLPLRRFSLLLPLVFGLQDHVRLSHWLACMPGLWFWYQQWDGGFSAELWSPQLPRRLSWSYFGLSHGLWLEQVGHIFSITSISLGPAQCSPLCKLPGVGGGSEQLVPSPEDVIFPVGRLS